MTEQAPPDDALPLQRQTGQLGRRVFGATLLLSGGRVLSKGFSLLNLVILARLLSPDDYGVVALAFTGIALLSAIFETGGGSYLVVREELVREHLHTAFTLQCLRGLILGAAVFLAARPFAALMGSDTLGPVLQVLALSPVISAFCNPAMQVYSRNLAFGREVVRDVLGAGLASAAAIGVAIWLQNYWALVAGTLIGNMMGMLLTYWRIPYRPRFSLKDWREFASFGGWIVSERIFSQVNTVAPQLVVWTLLSPAALGIYTVGRNIQKIPLEEALGPLQRSILPSLASCSKDVIALRRVFRKTQAVICGVALPVGVGMAFVAEEVILIMAGRQWLDAVIILQILSPALALKMAAGPVNNLGIALGKLPVILNRTVLLAVVTYPVLFLTTWWYDLPGAAVGLALLAGLRVVLNALLVRNMLGEPFFGLFVVGRRSIIAALTMGVVLAMLPEMAGGQSFWAAAVSLAVKILAGVLTYLTAHAILWLLEKRPDGVEPIMLEYAGLGFGMIRTAWGKRKVRSADSD